MKKIILFDGPTYGNVGDLAIAIAEKKFIKENLPQYEFIEVLDKEFDSKIDDMKSVISNNDIILLTGGGNLGDEYIFYEQRRRRVIKEFPNNKIIIMPQTIHFSDTEYGNTELEKTKKIYNEHKYLTVIAREKVSYDIMKKEFSNVNVILAPDIVMYLNETKKEKRDGLLMVMRDDAEKILTAEDIEKIKVKVFERFDKVMTTSTHIGDDKVNEYNRECVFEEKMEEFRKAQLVITDRLHGMIFSAITSTPCIAIGNYNHKIESSFDWLKDQKFIKFLKNFNEIESSINDLMKQESYIYNNEFALKAYRQILEVIND